MTGGLPLLWLGALAQMAGVATLRISWAREQRSAAINGAGWALLIAGAVTAAAAAGMWGFSVAALCAMGLATAFLAHAALTSPPGKAPSPARRARALPDRGEPLRIAGRVLTFVLTGIIALLASVALAVFSRWLAVLIGAHEANANVTALLVAPLAWGVLACWLLMLERRRAQFILLGASFVPLLPALLIGAPA